MVQLARAGRDAKPLADETARHADPVSSRVAKVTTGTGQNVAAMVTDHGRASQKALSHQLGQV